jgi:UDP-N-acetylmuramyl tripeptide synthase
MTMQSSPMRAGVPTSRRPGSWRPSSVRLRVSMWIALLARWLARRVGRHGGAIAGRILLLLCPEAPTLLARDRRILLVTGTNGKSTATAMLTAALGSARATGSNDDGANTPAGLVSALARTQAATVVLETDEAWLPWAIDRLHPQTVVLLNLTRDQLHRNPEVHLVAQSWREALTEVPLVVANADDPAVTWAASAAQRAVWVPGGNPWTEDSVVCPACGDLLHWDGANWSSTCGLARPAQIAEPAIGTVQLHLPGAVNRANAHLAIAAAMAGGAEPLPALHAIAELRAVAGRYQEFEISHHRVRLLLAKNPASWQETLRLVTEGRRPVVLVFNAEGVDGRDPSWLYDVDFTALRDRLVAVSGRRASDLSVRLRINEVASIGQFSDIGTALDGLPAGPVDLIANYTAFQEAYRRYA